jgi:hypothetical protein
MSGSLTRVTDVGQPGRMTEHTTAQSKGDRLRAIAAIHAFADTLARDPQIPLPSLILAHSVITTGEAGEARRAQQVISFAREHPGYRLSESDTMLQAACRFAELGTHGIEITHHHSTQLERREPRRYLS